MVVPSVKRGGASGVGRLLGAAAISAAGAGGLHGRHAAHAVAQPHRVGRARVRGARRHSFGVSRFYW